MGLAKKEDKQKVDVHSRKGINATSPPSRGLPSHLGGTTALSGCSATCSGCVSTMTTFERSRFR